MKKIATLPIFLLQGVSVKTSKQCEGESKHLLQGSRCGQNKNLEDVIVEQLRAEARCIV